MNFDKGKILSAFVWSAVCILLFFVFVGGIVRGVDTQDYPIHIKIASGISMEGLLHPLTFLKENCYPVWHILARTLMKVFGCEGRTAAIVLTVGCLLGTWACAAFYFLRKYREYEWEVVLAACVLLILVMPIWLPFFNPNIMLGQGGPNLLHNPTFLMGRLFAFPCFLWYVAIMEGISKETALHMNACRFIALSVLLLLSTLSKPSFVQMFFPAMFILAGFKVIRHCKRMVYPIVVVAMSFIPTLLLIGLQTWFSFYSSHIGSPSVNESGIGIAFLKVWSLSSPNVFVSILLAIFFPLIVLLWSIWARKVSTADVLAWIMCGVAALQGGFMYEKGPRWMHGNLFWAWNLALFIVWFTSIDRLIMLTREYVNGNVTIRQNCWFWCAIVALSLHLVSGICYLWRVLLWGNYS